MIDLYNRPYMVENKLKKKNFIVVVVTFDSTMTILRWWSNMSKIMCEGFLLSCQEICLGAVRVEFFPFLNTIFLLIR